MGVTGTDNLIAKCMELNLKLYFPITFSFVKCECAFKFNQFNLDFFLLTAVITV